MEYFSENDCNTYNYEPFLLINGNYQNALRQYDNFIINNYDFLFKEIDLINFNFLENKLLKEFKIKEIFENECNNFSQNEIYFYGCNLKIYESTYNNRLNLFLKKYCDVVENDFIKYELKTIVKYRFLFDETKKQIKYSIKKRNEYLKKRILEIDKSEHKQNDFDVNYFNKNCYELFLYLVENYNKKGKVKFINIFYFLKKEVDKKVYTFNFIQKYYTVFVKEKYEIEIKKYETVENFESERSVLNSHKLRYQEQKGVI